MSEACLMQLEGVNFHAFFALGSIELEDPSASAIKNHLQSVFKRAQLCCVLSELCDQHTGGDAVLSLRKPCNLQ